MSSDQEPNALALAAGTRIGPYEILGPLGAGGMGEVYRARDSDLGRDVAIKALPAAFSNDANRLARFEREARSLAAVNHPGIGAIYGVEKAGSDRFLVLELVAGETLARRLSRGPLPVAEALEVGRQIADALEAAHAKGLIHRDLKPANVMIAADGRVKLLDFGLAKGLDHSTPDPDPSQSPTLTATPTTEGVILGTAAYMSPEQARGRPVDQRTDIWSFGCVLYEVLTGRLAFAGETITDILAAVVGKEPDWAAIPRSTPWMVRSLLRRCLRKDPGHRMHHVADARIEIEEALDPSMIPAAPDPAGAKDTALAGVSHRRMLFSVLATFAVLVAHEVDKEAHVQSLFELVLLVVAGLAMVGLSWACLRSLGTPFWTGVSCAAAVWLFTFLTLPIEWGLMSRFATTGTAEPALTHLCVRLAIVVRFLYPGLAILIAYVLLPTPSRTPSGAVAARDSVAQLLGHPVVGFGFATANAVLFIILVYGVLVLPFELLAFRG
jgi:Protein kinase domain